MKYTFIAAHTQEYQIRRMCHALEVQRSGYYAWRRRTPSIRAQANQALLELIREEHEASRKTYGSPRIQKIVLRRKGIACGKTRVARLMHLHGIVAQKRHKWHPSTTQRQPGVVPAPNLLNQDFPAPAPNRKWVSDFTYIDTAEGWLYLAAVLDLFSRKVVGLYLSIEKPTTLTTKNRPVGSTAH